MEIITTSVIVVWILGCVIAALLGAMSDIILEEI